MYSKIQQMANGKSFLFSDPHSLQTQKYDLLKYEHTHKNFRHNLLPDDVYLFKWFGAREMPFFEIRASCKLHDIYTYICSINLHVEESPISVCFFSWMYVWLIKSKIYAREKWIAHDMTIRSNPQRRRGILFFYASSYTCSLHAYLIWCDS